MKIQFTNEQINEVMKSRGITRKSAVRWLSKQHAFPSRSVARPGAASATALAKDVKMSAANDKSEATPVKVKAEAKPQTDAGKARSAGIQDFILAGRPSKSDFEKVYGPTGPKLTWVARTALGVDAAHFQRALKAGKCVASVAK